MSSCMVRRMHQRCYLRTAGGTNSTEWYYAKRHLSDRFRLILWDLPGLGESIQPADRNFALERMASDLRSVLALAHGKPVVLVGQSIGGMINLNVLSALIRNS